ncbi:MAG: 3-dehydroquinate synthase II [Thermoplasmata archaeon]|nr:3-dehydroquinate synthase II [Thermoplasmata archaeon]
MTMDRLVLCPTTTEISEIRAFLARAERRGFHRFLVPATSVADASSPGRHLYSRIGDRIAGPAPSQEQILIVPVSAPADMQIVLERLRLGHPVAVRWSQERVIPLENLVAARSRPGTLWVVTQRVEEIPGFLGALEHGADTVVIELDSSDAIDALEAVLESRAIPLALERVPIQRIVPAGGGDRVIVDTTSLLRPEEGLLVGSSAAFLLHVASEAIGSRYTRPRPFRVNAGAAHSYTLLANGETRYLSELVAGDAVLVASPDGSSRSARVGRIKIERRPLVLIEIERGGRPFTIFLQEAETVRLTTPEGRIATTDLHAGNEVLGVSLVAGRHLGVAVAETIEER